MGVRGGGRESRWWEVPLFVAALLALGAFLSWRLACGVIAARDAGLLGGG